MRVRTRLFLSFLTLTSCVLMSVSFGQTVTCTYDDLNRLTRVDYGNGNYIDYSYDEVGNRTTRVSNFAASNPPLVITGEAHSVGDTWAVVTGTVNPFGDSTTAWFEWGTSVAYGNTTSSQDIGSGTASQNINAQLTGLTPETTYHYRIVSQNSFGTSYGDDKTFTTASMLLGDAKFGFAFCMGNTLSDNGYCIASDGNGDIYIAGRFEETVDFDPGGGVFNLTSDANEDIHVAKYTSSGALVWAKAMGGPEDDLAYAIAVDSSNNVYITGYFRGTADFDPGPNTFNLTALQGQDVFAVKLDSNGDLVWADAFIGASNYDCGFDIALDGGGNVFITGDFWNYIDIDPGPGTNYLWRAEGSSRDVFVIALTNDGALRGGLSIGGPGTYAYCRNIAVDSSGNQYITGWFAGTVDFDPRAGTFNLDSAGDADIFVTKLDTTGNLVWAVAMGGSNADRAYSIAVDDAENVYTTGYFHGTADFDPGPATMDLVSAGLRDIFVSKLDGFGNYIWARRMGGTGSDIAYAMAMDNLGNTFTAGNFNSTADFDPGPDTYNLVSTGSADVFVCKLSPHGSFYWAKSMGGPAGENGQGIAVDASGNVYTTGYFYDSADFDPGPGTCNFVSAGAQDIFVSKLVPNTAPEATNLTQSISGPQDAPSIPITPITVNDPDPGETITATLTIADTGEVKFGFAFCMGNTLRDNGYCIASDGNGDIYIAGRFEETVDFDPGGGVFNLTSDANEDIHVAKYTSSGALVWAKAMGGPEDDLAYAIAVDSSNNVYITGYFKGTADFDPGPNTFNLTAMQGPDAFAVKLDSNGDLVWAISLPGGGDYELGTGIALDASSNVYITGYFLGSIDIDPGPGSNYLYSVGGYDVFVVALTNDATLRWGACMGGTETDFSYGIAVDGPGNVYTIGCFMGTADFDPSANTFNLVSEGDKDIFVSKLDNNGNFIWAKSMGGPGYDVGYCITVDDGGNVYTAGCFNGTADFDPSPATMDLVSAGAEDIFVSKLDGLGNLVWSQRMGGTDDDRAFAIAMDDLGNTYTSGWFRSTADFDPGPGTFNLVSKEVRDIFVCSLDPNGSFYWANSMGGPDGENGQGITVDASGNVYTTGFFYVSADFDPGPGTSTFISAGVQDIFVSKLVPNTGPDANPGSLSVSGTATYDANTGVWTITGSLEEVNAALATVAFLPAAGYFGTTIIYVHIEDEGGIGPADSLISVTVIENEPPLITEGDGPIQLKVQENSTCLDPANEFALNATDPNGNDSLLTWSVKDGNEPVTGTVSFTGGVDTGPTVVICYQPTPGQLAADNFVIIVADDSGGTGEITINVTMCFEADIDCNYYVNWDDLSTFVSRWLQNNCDDPDWCDGTDLSKNGEVKFDDFGRFALKWLYCSDPANSGCDQYWK